MTAFKRFVLNSLVPAILALMLFPATSALGQVSSAPPSLPATQGAAAPSDTSSPAAQVQQPAERADVVEPGSGFSFLRVVGGLGLVLSLIVLGTYATRKLAPQYFSKKAAERSLKLIETLPMGERRSIAVIEIDERRLLIGNTPNQITLLASLGESGSFAANQDAAATTSPTPSESFKNLYEFERNGPGRSKVKIIPPDVRAKMRQLRETLER